MQYTRDRSRINMHRIPLFVCLTCLTLLAQAEPGTARPEIRGLVLEANTQQPVVGAEVSLYFLGEKQPMVRFGFASMTPQSAATTDATGAFAFHPGKFGYYAVGVKQEGYVQPDRMVGGNTRDVTLTTDNPSIGIRLSLSRPAEVRGILVDEETEKPLPGIKLLIGRVLKFGGMLRPAGETVSTGPDGRFVASRLTPGDYVVVVRPQQTGEKRILKTFTDADLKRVDSDYELTYWPGGQDLATVVPFPVGSGAVVDVGKVRARRTSYYRLHLYIAEGACEPQQTLTIWERVQRNTMPIGKVPCRPDLVIAGFAPGSYRLMLYVSKASDETRAAASVPFVITDKGEEITAALERGLRVTAKIVAAEGVKPPDYSKILLALYPENGFPMGGYMMPAAPDSNGIRRFVGVQRVEHSINLMGLGATHYVKEVLYNGHRLPDQLIPLGHEEMASDLTIVVDDKPATITGVVMEGDKPVYEPYVISRPWPLPAHLPSGYMPSVSGDAKGRFQVTGLPPGTYRLVAVRSIADDFGRGPGALERALESAPTIEVGPSAIQNVNLELKELR